MSEPVRSEVEAALAWYDRNFGDYPGTGHPEVRVMAEVARAWLSTPTEPTGETDVVAELRFARDAIQGWAGYASDYFKDKWDLDGDLARIDAAIAALAAGRVPTEPSGEMVEAAVDVWERSMSFVAEDEDRELVREMLVAAGRVHTEVVRPF